MKISKTDAMLNKNFETQLKFLKASSKSYDEGFEDEAQRMATSLRVLLHDTVKSESLFKLLGIKKMFYVSSNSIYIPVNEVSYTGLLGMSFMVGGEAKYLPNCKLNDTTQNMWLNFGDWWNYIIIDDKTNIFTRKDLVLYCANKDGGAHVDKKIDKIFYDLIFNNSIGWEYSENNASRPLDNNVIYASIRQIVHELLFSVEYHNAIVSFTRTISNDLFKACYINEKLYFNKKCDKDDISNALYKDDRVTFKQDRKLYIDKLKLKNSGEVVRNVLVNC